MQVIANIGFASPLVLWAILLLPVIWWLLRLTPPRPDKIVFPPIRLLLGLRTRENTPAHSPWWLTLLRMALATILIIALADPILHPQSSRPSLDGPLVLVVDNGWAAANDWTNRRNLLREEIERARQTGSAVILVPTAPSSRPQGLMRETGSNALAHVDLIAPQPHPPQRMAVIPRLEDLLKNELTANIVWLADGIKYADEAGFAHALENITPTTTLQIYRPDSGAGPLALLAPDHGNNGLEIGIIRADGGLPREGLVVARALNGRILGESHFSVLADERLVTIDLNMPLELRNEVSRIEIDNQNSAGAVRLLDERWKKKRVGLIAGEDTSAGQPLLSPLFYVERALAPYAELTLATNATVPEGIASLIEARVGAIILTDIGILPGESLEALEAWLSNGGILVRFAGPRLSASNSTLVPVKLRDGARALGGTLSWSTPQELAEFADHGAFNSIRVPSGVLISRQVLAEPDIALSTKTWARLADGTPLVTADQRGNGWVILFHVTANPTWSSLPLSGVFVDMLRALIDLAGNASVQNQSPDLAANTADVPSLPPVTVLNATGDPGAPPPTATPIPANTFDETRAGPAHPPGFYGHDTALRALNTLAHGEILRPMLALPESAQVDSYARLTPEPLRPWLFVLAALLLVLDTFAILLITGFKRQAPGAKTATLLLSIMALSFTPVDQTMAQELTPAEEFALQATARTRLAYVITGIDRIDEVSRAGLHGLSVLVGRRTALEPGDPMGVDISRDELALFPLIYWAVDPSVPQPNAEAMARIDAYMRRGGTILFDTRDQVLTTGANGPGMAALQRILANLDIPALEPVPADHVLTKAFYLLQDFPGRYDGGSLWTEATTRDAEETNRPARNSDGVSSILITSNDLAAAWAIDDRGRPLLPVVPGGDRQREMAYRVGINLVMYTLTGNYKADQVHIPALLERLGQ